MPKRKYVHITAESDHCFDFSVLISAIVATYIYSMPDMPGKEFFACGS